MPVARSPEDICLQSASPKEKSFFLAVLCALARIDGDFKAGELRYIKELARRMKAEMSPQVFACSPEDCCRLAAEIKNRRLALELIKNMFILAYTDNEFTDSEGRFICDIGNALHIEPQKISQISSWIIDQIIWLEQKALIFEDTPQKGAVDNAKR